MPTPRGGATVAVVLAWTGAAEVEESAGVHLGWFAVGTVLFARALLACAAMRRVPFLPEIGAPGSPGGEPQLLVIVCARNADDVLTGCLDDLGRQLGAPDVVVVDDRSAAPLAIEACCDDRPHVRLTRVAPGADEDVPWATAFAHGLAASNADPRWVVMLEQPCRLLVDDALARALRHAERERASALWLLPSAPTPWWLTPSRLTALADAMPAMAAINSGRESVHLPGLPALVRRDVLTAVLREPDASAAPLLEQRITERLIESGGRARCAIAADELRTPPARWPDVREGLERLLAMLQFRSWLVVAGLALYGVVWAPAVAGAFAIDPWGVWAFGGLLSLAIPAWLCASATHSSHLPALAAPLVYPAEVVVTIWLTLRAVRRGEVRWRDKRIPLSRLRSATERG